jgi:hypothetical protein
VLEWSDQTVTGAVYLDMPDNYAVPHFWTPVAEVLNEQFAGLWTDRGGPILWPSSIARFDSRSFSPWGYDIPYPHVVISITEVEDDCNMVLAHKKTVLVMVIKFTGWSKVICGVGNHTERWKEDFCSPGSIQVDSLSLAPWSYKHT